MNPTHIRQMATIGLAAMVVLGALALPAGPRRAAAGAMAGSRLPAGETAPSGERAGPYRGATSIGGWRLVRKAPAGSFPRNKPPDISTGDLLLSFCSRSEVDEY